MGLSPLDLVPFVGAGLDFVSGQTNARAARKAFNNRYQNTVVDMKKAGLNPALAYGQGGGNPQTHDLPMVGGEMASGVAAMGGAKQARANAAKTEQETELLKAQTADIIANLRAKNKLLGAEFDNRLASTGLIGAQTEYTRGPQTEATGAQAFKSRMEGNYQQERNKMLAETRDSDVVAQLARNAADMFAPKTAAATQRGIELENEIKRLSLPQLQSMADYYRGAGKYQPYADAIVRYLDRLIPKANVQIGGGNAPYTPDRPKGWNP